MRKLIIVLLTSTLTVPAYAQDISGGVDLKTSYALGDFGYEGGPDPVFQGYVDIAIGDTGCKASGWGNLSLGQQIGNEIDLGAGCTFNLNDETQVTITGTRYLLLDQGVPDMNAGTVVLKHGAFDAQAGIYLWDRLPDGFAAQVGYTAEVHKFTFRGSVHYATGLGDNSIIFFGAKASYLITDNLSVGVQGYMPAIKSENDPRKTQLVGSLSYSF